MDRYQKIIFFMLCFLLFGGACISLKQPSKKIEFYALEYKAPRMTGNLETLPVVIRIERFNVAPAYNTNRIIYSDRSFKRNAYVYHQWRNNPGDMVTHL